MVEKKGSMMKKILAIAIAINLMTANITRTKTYRSNQEETPASREEKQKNIFQWFRTIAEVSHLISEKHFRSIDFPKFIQEGLKAALPQTDSHSAFLPQKSYKATLESTSGEFSGIGVSIMTKAPEDDSIVIIDVIQGGPSEKAGVLSGDKIVSVDKTALKGLTADETVNLLRGKIGTEVKVKVLRDKKPLEFSIKRDIIKDQSAICFEFTKQNVTYLSLKMFTETATKQITELFEKANKDKCKGIILDLRRNQGGILEVAVDMASLFIPQDSTVVVTKNKNLEVVHTYKTNKKPILNAAIPIFILIDNFTASASEILAGCLKYYSQQEETIPHSAQKAPLMVFLVGTETFGKGSVQEVIPISNGCAIKLTTMLYYLPNDISIQAKGIEPDFLIQPKAIPTQEMKWINELYGKETSLKSFINEREVQGLPAEDPEKKDVINKKEKKESDDDNDDADDKDTTTNEAEKFEERHRKAVTQDVQIQACVNMINLLNTTKNFAPQLVDTRKKAFEFLQTNYLTDTDIEVKHIK